MSSQAYWENLQAAYRARQVVWLIAALVIFSLLWAAFSKLDEVVVGDGKVVPSSSVHLVQSLEGGILREVKVEVGQQVAIGQDLIVLDDTRFRAAFQEAEQSRFSLTARRFRLAAELESVAMPSEGADARDILVQEVPLQLTDIPDATANNARASYAERLNQLRSQLNASEENINEQAEALSEAEVQSQTLRRSLALVNEEIALVSELVESGSVAEIELLALKRDRVSFEGELEASLANQRRIAAGVEEAVATRRNVALDFRARVQAELNDTDTRLAQLGESLTAQADQLARTRITSPVSGIVKDIAIRSVGGVVRPGEPILEIIPLDDQLIVETRISPRDIAFVENGLTASVKFSAYDFVVYGGLQGEVTYVSADALQDEDGTTYYRAHIRTNTNSLNEWPIIPGMQATVDILTGQKTVLSYWLKPILRARATALREP